MIEPEAFVEIAKLVIKNKTGARGLRGIFNTFFSDSLFECAGGKTKKICVLSAEDVKVNRPSTLRLSKSKAKEKKANG